MLAFVKRRLARQDRKHPIRQLVHGKWICITQGGKVSFQPRHRIDKWRGPYMWFGGGLNYLNAFLWGGGTESPFSPPRDVKPSIVHVPAGSDYKVGIESKSSDLYNPYPSLVLSIAISLKLRDKILNLGFKPHSNNSFWWRWNDRFNVSNTITRS